MDKERHHLTDKQKHIWLIVIGVTAGAGLAVIIYLIIKAAQKKVASSSAAAATTMSNNNPMLTNPIMQGGTTQTTANVSNGVAAIGTNQLTPAQRTRIRDPAAFEAYQAKLQAAAENIGAMGLSTTQEFIGFYSDNDAERLARLPDCTQDPTTGIITCTDNWSQSSSTSA